MGVYVYVHTYAIIQMRAHVNACVCPCVHVHARAVRVHACTRVSIRLQFMRLSSGQKLPFAISFGRHRHCLQ